MARSRDERLMEERTKRAYERLVMEPNEVTAVRNHLGLSEDELALALGVSTGRTVRRWEAGDNDVTGSAVVLMFVLMNSPEARELLGVGEFLPKNEYVSPLE